MINLCTKPDWVHCAHWTSHGYHCPPHVDLLLIITADLVWFKESRTLFTCTRSESGGPGHSSRCTRSEQTVQGTAQDVPGWSRAKLKMYQVWVRWSRAQFKMYQVWVRQSRAQFEMSREHQPHCNVTFVIYRVKRRVILEHIGCGPKWTIQVSPDAPFWGDSKSGGPKLIPFLIRQEKTKYSWKACDVKLDLLRFGWFNLYQDPFFEGIVNLATELLYLVQDMCYIQNGDRGPGEG